MQPLPAEKETLVFFAVALSRSLAPSSIQVYVAAVGSLHRKLGYRVPTHNNPRLQLVLRGAKRAHVRATRSTREPITGPILRRLLTAIKDTRSLSGHDKRLLAAAFSLAFFGMLRISELTPPSTGGFNHRIHPTRDCVDLRSGWYTFHIKRSKTDQLQHGAMVHISQSGSKLCPVRAMRNYLQSGKSQWQDKDPLFIFSNNKLLTRRSCLKHLRHFLQRVGYPPSLYNMHSFIGAATHAAHLGMPSHHIKLLGRWRSAAYQRYSRSCASTIRRAASHLASSFAKHS